MTSLERSLLDPALQTGRPNSPKKITFSGVKKTPTHFTKTSPVWIPGSEAVLVHQEIPSTVGALESDYMRSALHLFHRFISDGSRSTQREPPSNGYTKVPDPGLENHFPTGEDFGSNSSSPKAEDMSSEHGVNVQGVDISWIGDGDGDDDVIDEWDSAQPVRFSMELSLRGKLRRLFMRNPKTRVRLTTLDLIARILICILYIVRVELDDQTLYECYGSPCGPGNNRTWPEETGSMKFTSTAINWYVLLWVHRPYPLWGVQVAFALIMFFKALVQLYISNKGSRLQLILTLAFVLELICTIPFIVTFFNIYHWKNLFVPVFLNCWLAKTALQKLFNDLHLTRRKFQSISVTLSQQSLLLTATIVCIIYTTICGIQHMQRGSEKDKMTVFESLYFVIVTFSTVGYGDISPDTWLSQSFMLLMICVAFIAIPRQLEVLASVWHERKKAGGEYNRRTASNNKHVVVCARSLTIDSLMNFLSEFYAHPKLENYRVVFLCPSEIDNKMQMILKDPKWTYRVIYIRGSALKDEDLKRCRIMEAEACFILAPRGTADRIKADRHAILRSWAIKDFAPKCKQYIQLFKAESKIHVKFAEQVVCEDEFKYALLANNCLYPGFSTLVTLLLHTSHGGEGDLTGEAWQQIYGHHAANEIYHIQLQRSAFFRSCDNMKFTEAAAYAHKRFGVTLIAILDITKVEPKLQLNPGPDYVLKGSDYCFYMSVEREEFSKIKSSALKDDEREYDTKNVESSSLAPIQEGRSLAPIPEEMMIKNMAKWSKVDESTDNDNDLCDESIFNTITSQLGNEITKLRDNDTANVSITDLIGRLKHKTEEGKISMGDSTEEYMVGMAPVTLCGGNRRAICYLSKELIPVEKLEWGSPSCPYKFGFDKQLIILATEYASNGIYNFIVPLRSHFLGVNHLSPIILLLEHEPDTSVTDIMRKFPLVFWMKGKITNIDDLLKAGINKSSHLVIVNKEITSDVSEETLDDAETIVNVQTILKLFPNANIITELTQASNIRFMRFSADDEYAQKISRLEKKLQERISSSLSHMFRLPFASGQIFSGGMLDRLLYQTFVKGYFTSFVRLMLGMDSEENSGHLSSIRVTRATLTRFPTYGDLFDGLGSTTGEIPIAIFRYQRKPDTNENQETDKELENNNERKSGQSFKYSFTSSNPNDIQVKEVIREKMTYLELDEDEYCDYEERKHIISYPILNPGPKRKLKHGDIVYVIQPSGMFAVPSRRKWSTLNRNRNYFRRGESVSTPSDTHRPSYRKRCHSESLSHVTEVCTGSTT